MLAVVDLHAEPAQVGHNLPGGSEHLCPLLFGLPYGNDDGLDGRQARGQDQPLVVAVDHDNGADETRAQAPARRPAETQLAVGVLIRDVECAGEVLAQVVRGGRLERTAVPHYGFYGVTDGGAGELLALALAPLDDGHGRLVLGEVRVNVQHLPRLRLGLFARGVGGVALLPEELRRAQEQPGPQLPPHHVGPLVDQHRQVAVALDPLGVHVADDRLGGRADDQRLFQLLAAPDGDDRQLGAESLDVLRFLLQEAPRDEEREVGVLVARLFEAAVQAGPHVLPQGVAVRTDHHAAAHGRIVGQLGLLDDLVIPAGEILGALRQAFGQRSLLTIRLSSTCRSGCAPTPPVSSRGGRFAHRPTRDLSALAGHRRLIPRSPYGELGMTARAAGPSAHVGPRARLILQTSAFAVHPIPSRALMSLSSSMPALMSVICRSPLTSRSIVSGPV